MAASNPYLRWAATESSTPPARYSYKKKKLVKQQFLKQQNIND
jgi:hypothetical protein